MKPSDDDLRMLRETYIHCRKWAHAGEVGRNAVTLLAAIEELLALRTKEKTMDNTRKIQQETLQMDIDFWQKKIDVLQEMIRAELMRSDSNIRYLGRLRSSVGFARQRMSSSKAALNLFNSSQG